MFDHDHRQNWQQAGSQRFGNDNQLWSNEPSADSLEKLQRMGNLLAMRLGPEYLSTRQGPGGSKLTYLEGWRAISLANEVFGFNGWSSSVKDISIDFVGGSIIASPHQEQTDPIRTYQLDYNEEAARWSVHVTAIVRVTLPDGCYHEDVGCGKMDNCKSKADALDKVKKEAVTDAMKRALRNFGNLMGNCIYDKKFLDDISKVKAPGKVPLDFSTLHRPGQNYDIDGKIIPAGVKAELDKAPVAGPSNAGQANVTNTGAQPVNQAKQQNNRQMVQSKPMAPQPKQQMPAQKAPQIAQQGQRQQIQQNPNNNPLRSVMQAQQAPPPRKHQGTTSVIQNRMQIDPNRSLNSEDMYEGMDDGDNDIEEDTIEGKYDDSGFGEGNTSAAYGQPQRAPPQNQPLPNNNNRNQLPQMNQNRATVSQKQPQQVRQAQSNFNGANQGGRETILHQNAQNRPQQVYQNNQGLPKQMQPLNNPPISHNSTHVRRISGEHRENDVNGRPHPKSEGGDEQYLYAQTQPVHSQAHRSSGNQTKQGQAVSPVNRLNAHVPNPRANTIAYTSTNGMPPLASVNFRSSTTGVKRPLPSDDETVSGDNLPMNPAIQQAQQGQQGIQRAMSPSERARIAEQQAQQQQLIAQKKEAAQEKRQRLQGGRSSGHKPVSA